MTDLSLRRKFGPALRIRKAGDFDRVFASGCRVRCEGLTLLGLANGLDRARLGISVPKRMGGAVVRNRVKRVVREAFRACRRELPAMDLVCVPQVGLAESVAAVRQMLVDGTGRLWIDD